MEKYILNGRLSVQVKATIHCYKDCVETLDVNSDDVIQVPPDDIRDKMFGLYKDGAFSDATITCGDDEFKVHKAVLGSQSAVLKRMFEVDMKEKQSSIVNISDIHSAVMSDLIAYLYTGSAPNVNTMAKELLNVANKYELPRLFAMCERELKSNLSVADVVDTLILADLHGSTELKKACLSFIHLHAAEVLQTSKWKSLKDHYGMLLVETLEYSMAIHTN
jgi:speckle-type POZ protein